MRRCPYCAEQIQEAAVKCKHCMEFLDGRSPVPHNAVPWYSRASIIILAFLCVGPLALPLLWLRPGMRRTTKIVLTLIVLAISYYLGVAFIHALQQLKEYYQILGL